MKVSGWGRYLWVDANISLPRSPTDCLKEGADFPVIPRGAGRSYGDSANQSSIIQSTYLNHFWRGQQRKWRRQRGGGLEKQSVASQLAPDASGTSPAGCKSPGVPEFDTFA